MKVEKGQAGYLNYKKNNDIFFSVVISTIAIIVLIVGLLLYKTRLNYLTIVSILIFLPAARRLVYAIIRLRFKSFDLTKAKEYDKKFPHLRLIYDLVFSTEKEFYHIDVMTISGGKIYAYSKSLKDIDNTKNYLLSVLKKNNIFGYDIKIYLNQKDFEDRLDGLDIISEIEDNNVNNKTDEIINLFYLITL